MLEPPPEPPESPPPPEPPPKQITLGLDAPLPPSNTWLGFLDYLKHAGPLAEVEQAEFSPEPMGAESDQPPRKPQPPIEAAMSPAEQSPSPPTEAPTENPAQQPPPEESNQPEAAPVNELPVVEPVEKPSEVPPEDLTPSEEVDEPKPSAGRPEESPAKEPAQQKEPMSDSPEGELPLQEKGPTPAETVQWIQSLREAAQQALREAMQAEAEQAKEPELTAQTESSESPPQPEQAQPQPAIPPQPPPGPAGRGDASDKESDASSIIEVPKDQWERGRPIASPGLELKPRKPHFTILTMITSAPCNPLCEITFGHDGVPTRARLLSGSCDSRVDEGILNSLYGWRASGEKLNALRPGQTVTLEIRLILTRRK